jgi:hypothetical protein
MPSLLGIAERKAASGRAFGEFACQG